jgi:hypothetical protein
MLSEKGIDELIEAGWHVLESDFRETAFQKWRRETLKFLTEMLGPKHMYTRYFQEHLQHLEGAELRTAGGILVLGAAKKEMAQNVH